MDSKQLLETGRQIVKAAEGGDPPSTLLSLLQPLQKWTATEDVLRQSKIGVSVNKLRQSRDPKVSELAARLINKWKGDVNASKKKSSPAPAAAPVKKEVRKSTVEPEKRNSRADAVNTEVTGNQTRDSCVKLMYDGLAFLSEESECGRQLEGWLQMLMGPRSG